MTGIIEPESIAEKLKQTAKQYLERMREGKYDIVWHQMITPEAAKLLSTALFPVHMYKEGKTDEFLKSYSDGSFTISFDEAFAIGFQMDMEQMRSSFFAGVAGSMEPIGWYDAAFEDCLTFVDESSALLIETSPQVPVIFLFVEQPDGSYKIDFEAIMLFSMQVTASSLYHIGTRALELGQSKSAIAYFELAASFAHPYSRIERLMLNHFIVQQIITDARKQELLEEGKYVLLARHQVLKMLSSPKVSPMAVNMGQFLVTTFQGYAEIPEVETNTKDIEQLYELDDAYLRQSLAAILNGVNPVVAQREANKPHGPHEISDMELTVQHGGNIYRLSMPIKSGREIKEDSVPVNVAYQIIRPFLHFPDGLVVFVTAKPCSQYLHNYIKAANDILGLSIEVIEHHELARLLKLNNLLPPKKAS
jgi:hypothetical protein